MDVTLLRHNLSVLSRVEHGDKVCTVGTRFDVRAPGLAQSTMRWLAGEARGLNVECVKFTIGSALATLTLCDIGDPYSIIAERESVKLALERDLRNAKDGLSRLKHTYRDDVGTEIQISAIAEQIGNFLHRRQCESSPPSQRLLCGEEAHDPTLHGQDE